MRQIYAIRTEPHLESLAMPENLRIGLMTARQRERCSRIGCHVRYFNFALGQSPFPVPPALSAALRKEAGAGHYTDAAGVPELRDAVAEYYEEHFRVHAGPEQVIVGNGTEEILYILFTVLDAEVVIPSPSWAGYAPILRLLGKTCTTLSLNREDGYRINSSDLEAILAKNPDRRHLLVLNNPNNPTGALYSRQELARIADVCRRYGCLVLADEVYALTTYRPEDFCSMGAVYPEGTFVTGGLSHDCSAAGYRLGVCVIPEGDQESLMQHLTRVAATMYTSVATPIQYAAVAAYAGDPAIKEYVQTTREIHRVMGGYMSRAFEMIEGVEVTHPEGGFYFLADFSALAGDLAQSGVRYANDLSRALLDHPHHVATVSGDALMLPSDVFATRIAFVDYDGRRAMELYREKPPETGLDEIAFVQDAAPRMVEGVEAVRKFVEGVRRKTIRFV
ncbi:pyridoxal phosphate-dependent aminotransferase [uncultured Methanofollis sp.]|uniref:pyridoxal phosphate-dependent aminotransferase n=1 Tax=uncultured Methanofollis sp. TaxID=262500 RepID=UPI002639F4B3|nr:aminotransferase class I/II-fold pyridoxal phosphate-dependent enzyme [uncultured Methanofollis sp.]